MRYIINVEGLRGQVFDNTIGETDSSAMAISAAKSAWFGLSEADRNNQRITVIESANSDPAADNHMDGNYVLILTNEAYWTMVEYLFPAFWYDGEEYVAIESPRYETEPDWSEGGTACWFEARAIKKDEPCYHGTEVGTYLVHWDIENSGNEDVDEGTALDLVDWDYPSNVEQECDVFNIRDYMK